MWQSTEQAPWGRPFARQVGAAHHPLPLHSSHGCGGDTVRTRMGQSSGGGKAKPPASGYTVKWGSHSASLVGSTLSPTRPCVAQSRCSVNVWRMDECHRILTRSYKIQTGRGPRGAWRMAPTHVTSGSEHHCQMRSPCGPPPPRGFKTHAAAGLLPLSRHWPRSPTLVSNRVAAPRIRTCNWPNRCVISGCL